MIRCVGFCGVLLSWWLVTVLRLVPPVLIPSPQAVLSKAITMIANGELLHDTRPTLIRTVIGFIIGCICGVGLGLIIGRSLRLRMALEGVIDFLRSIPVIVVFPLFVLALGLSDVSKIVGIAWAAVPIMAINTMYGVSTINRTRREWCELSSIKGLRYVVLCEFWEILPAVFSGMRTAFAASLVMSVVSEMMFGSKLGLGRLILDSSQMFETSTMYVGILVVGIIGYAGNACFVAIEVRLRDWS